MEDDVAEFEELLRGTGDEVNHQFKPPSMESIMTLIDSIGDMSDEEKEQLKQDVMSNAMHGTKQVVQQVEVATNYLSPQILTMISLVILVTLILGFFTYSIIKHNQTKINKREEKRRLKDEKKNKNKRR